MRSSLQTSSLRFLKARLMPFTKPMFWGSATILTLVGLAIWQYWQHPEWIGTNDVEQPFTIRNNSADNNFDGVGDDPTQLTPQLSQEDLAVAADIDNSELLIQEMQPAQTQVNLTAPKTSIEKNTSDDFLGKNQTSSLIAKNSLSSQLKQSQQNAFDFDSALTNNNSSVFGQNQNNKTAANNNSDFSPPRSVFTTQKFGSNRPVNYLQQALNQPQNQTIPEQNSVQTEVEPSQTQTYTGYNAPVNSYSNSSNSNRTLRYPNYSYGNSYRNPLPSSVNSNSSNYNSYNNLPQNNYQQFRPSITTSTGTNTYGNSSLSQPNSGNTVNTTPINSNNNSNTYGNPDYNQPSTNNTSGLNSQTPSNNSNYPTFSESTDFNRSAFDNSGFVTEP